MKENNICPKCKEGKLEEKTKNEVKSDFGAAGIAMFGGVPIQIYHLISKKYLECSYCGFEEK